MNRVRLTLIGLAAVAALGTAAVSPRAWSGGAAGTDEAGEPLDEPSAEFVARFKKAQLLLGSGKDARAERALRELSAERPRQPEVHHALGVLLQFRKRPSEALAALEHAAELAPGDAIIRRDVGLEHLRHDRPTAALAHLEASAVLVAQDVETLNGLGLARLQTGRPAAAEQAFRATLAIEAGSVDALVGLAHARLAVDPEETLTILAKLPPHFADVRIVSGLALERLKRYEEAGARLIRGAELLAIHPASAPLLRAAAESLLRSGDARHGARVATAWIAAERAEGVFAPGAEDGREPSLRARLCLAECRAALGDGEAALVALRDPGEGAAAPESAVLVRARLLRAMLLASAEGSDAPLTTSAALRELMDAHPGTFEALAAGHMAGEVTRDELLAAAPAAGGAWFGPLTNDAHWVIAVRAHLDGDETAATKHLRIGAKASVPPGEFPGMLIRSRLPR